MNIRKGASLTTVISVDLAHHEIFRVKVGKGGIKIFKRSKFSVTIHRQVCLFVCLILYVPSTIFQLYRDESSWVEPVLS